MPIIQTADLKQGQSIPDQQQVYNALDACLTVEILEALRGLHNAPPPVYSFERALQGPVLDMMLRGFAVDELERRSAITTLRTEVQALLQTLNRFAVAVWDKPLNPRAQTQLQEFFFKAMHLPEVWSSKKGERKLSMDREALEKLEVYFHARPIIYTILAIRDKQKQIETLESEIDPDKRFRTSYNIGGTETLRFSSSTNAFGTGGNAQNWAAALKRVFISDPGYKLCVIDLEQSESREVGFQLGTLFGDWSSDACESGDLHTQVASMVWPNLGWTDDKKANRKIADQIYYRDFSYRDMAKRLGHASNYVKCPSTLARILRHQQSRSRNFPTRLLQSFPRHLSLACLGSPTNPDPAQLGPHHSAPPSPFLRPPQR